jgi:hypothetical protein
MSAVILSTKGYNSKGFAIHVRHKLSFGKKHLDFSGRGKGSILRSSPN